MNYLKDPKPEVIILTPTYDPRRFEYLREAIQSVLIQTFQDYKIIIIDDNPLRENVGQLEDLVHLDPRIKLIRNPQNKGIAGSRNRGIIFSEQMGYTPLAYCLIDDDDRYISPEKLTRHIFELQRNDNLGLVGSNGHYVDGLGNRKGRSNMPETHHKILNRVNFAFPFLPSSLAIRGELLRTLKFRENLLGSDDYELLFRILSNGHETKNVPDVLTYYRIHGSNTTQTKARELLTEKRNVIKENGAEFPNYQIGLMAMKFLELLGPSLKAKFKEFLFIEK